MSGFLVMLLSLAFSFHFLSGFLLIRIVCSNTTNIGQLENSPKDLPNLSSATSQMARFVNY